MEGDVSGDIQRLHKLNFKPSGLYNWLAGGEKGQYIAV